MTDALLYNPPEERNEGDMSEWLLSVLLVSDPTTSVASNSLSHGNNESSEAANSNNGSSSSTNANSSSREVSGPQAEISSPSSPASEEAVLTNGGKEKTPPTMRLPVSSNRILRNQGVERAQIQ
jgi:hypothetical protein